MGFWPLNIDAPDGCIIDKILRQNGPVTQMANRCQLASDRRYGGAHRYVVCSLNGLGCEKVVSEASIGSHYHLSRQQGPPYG